MKNYRGTESHSRGKTKPGCIRDRRKEKKRIEIEVRKAAKNDAIGAP